MTHHYLYSIGFASICVYLLVCVGSQHVAVDSAARIGTQQGDDIPLSHNKRSLPYNSDLANNTEDKSEERGLLRSRFELPKVDKVDTGDSVAKLPVPVHFSDEEVKRAQDVIKIFNNWENYVPAMIAALRGQLNYHKNRLRVNKEVFKVTEESRSKLRAILEEVVQRARDDEDKKSAQLFLSTLIKKAE